MFAGERIEAGLKKGKFDYAASTNSGDKRPGANGKNKKEGRTHAMAIVLTWPNFPPAQQRPLLTQPSSSISPSPPSLTQPTHI